MIEHDPTRFDPTGTHFELQTQLYQLRAEEFERNFLSFRSVEWPLAFQIYAGYALVGAGLVASNAATPSNPLPPTPSAFALLLLLIIFGSSLFCQLQIQRRMHFTRSMQNAYLNRLHEALAPSLPIPAGTIAPRYQKWWAFVPMLLVNLASLCAVAGYIVRATRWCW